MIYQVTTLYDHNLSKLQLAELTFAVQLFSFHHHLSPIVLVVVFVNWQLLPNQEGFHCNQMCDTGNIIIDPMQMSVIAAIQTQIDI